MRGWFRFLITLLGVVSGIVLAYGTLLAFPEPLFEHRYDYREFAVYSHRPLDARIEPILDTVSARLAASPWNTPGMHHRVFVAGTPGWYTFFNGPYRVAMGTILSRSSASHGRPACKPTVKGGRWQKTIFQGIPEAVAAARSVFSHSSCVPSSRKYSVSSATE